MYRKEPAAKQAQPSSIMSFEFYKIIPSITPIGVNTANRIIIFSEKFFSSGKVLPMDIPNDMPAAPLCNQIATAKKRVELKSPVNPRASPSNIA